MSTTALSDVSCPIDDDYVRCRWPAAGGLEEVTIKADHGDPFQLASSADFWDFFGPSFEDSRPDTLSGEPVDGPVDSLYPFLESRWGEVDVTQGSMPSWSERGGEPPPQAPSLAQEIDSVGSQGSISPAWYGSYSAQSSIGRQTCTHCSESFTNGKELEKHAVESNHRSYRCPSPGCEKTYCRRDVLLRHKATHKDVTQLQCEHCLRTDRPRSFTRRDHYNQHLRTHHPHALGPHHGDSVKRRKPEYDEVRANSLARLLISTEH